MVTHDSNMMFFSCRAMSTYISTINISAVHLLYEPPPFHHDFMPKNVRNGYDARTTHSLVYDVRLAAALLSNRSSCPHH